MTSWVSVSNNRASTFINQAPPPPHHHHHHHHHHTTTTTTKEKAIKSSYAGVSKGSICLRVQFTECFNLICRMSPRSTFTWDFSSNTLRCSKSAFRSNQVKTLLWCHDEIRSISPMKLFCKIKKKLKDPPGRQEVQIDADYA